MKQNPKATANSRHTPTHVNLNKIARLTFEQVHGAPLNQHLANEIFVSGLRRSKTALTKGTTQRKRSLVRYAIDFAEVSYLLIYCPKRNLILKFETPSEKST